MTTTPLYEADRPYVNYEIEVTHAGRSVAYEVHERGEEGLQGALHSERSKR